MAERRAQDVLDYWFGPDLTDPGLLSARMRFWFAASALRALPSEKR